MTTKKYKKKVVPFVEKLDSLKTKMLNETDFSVPFKYFFDQIMDDRAFNPICKKVKRPILQGVLDQIAQKVVEGCSLSKILFLKPPSYPFVHGFFPICAKLIK